MAEAADYGLMIWDAKSTGTLSNVIELLSRKKKSLVFVNKEKEFKVVGRQSARRVDYFHGRLRQAKSQRKIQKL